MVGKRGTLILNHIVRNFEVLIISSCQFVTYHCVANQSKYTIPDQNIPEHTRTFSKYTNSHHSGLTQIAQSHSSRNQSKSFQTGSLSVDHGHHPLASALSLIQLVHPSRRSFYLVFICPPAVNESKFPCSGWLFCVYFYNQF